MSDSNVIRPVFGKRPPEPAVPQEDTPSESDMSEEYKHIGPLTGDALLRAQKDLVYMLRNKDHVGQVRDQLEKLGDMVFSLKNFSPSDQNITLRRQGLQSESLEALCVLAESLTESQCRAQPSYLGALTLEHNARIQVALSLMNE